jgi:hypothetical protein
LFEIQNQNKRSILGKNIIKKNNGYKVELKSDAFLSRKIKKRAFLTKSECSLTLTFTINYLGFGGGGGGLISPSPSPPRTERIALILSFSFSDKLRINKSRSLVDFADLSAVFMIL